MRLLGVALGVFAFVSACDSHPRDAKTPDPELTNDHLWGEDLRLESRSAGCRLDRAELPPSCMGGARPIRVWGPITVQPRAQAHCPVRVRVAEAGVVAEALTTLDRFEPAPNEECVPDKYLVGTRRSLHVDDGWIIAYAGPFDGDAFWLSEDGLERRFISRARFAGFARAPSGTILALGIGPARLGHGGVVALEHRGRGEYVPRLVATLSLEPSPVVFDDDGRLLTFVQGFVVRIDEHGNVENLHYVARDLGRIASIAASPDGDVYLGLDCGVLRIAHGAEGSSERWWSVPCVETR